MAGIAGWVDFDRDLTRDRRIVMSQLGAVALRGPDEEGLWADTHAVLGHRRRAVLDPGGSRQPMAAVEDGQPAAVVSFDGEIANFAELREELSSRGHRFRHRGDTEVLLRAYLEWGDQCPRHLDGMFAFAVWDVRRQHLLLVRDRLGAKPLFYYPTANGVVFGSEPKAVMAHPLVDAVVDADGLRELLAFTSTPGHGVFRGLQRVRPGATVTVDRSGCAERAYWTLEAAPHTDDERKTVQTVRETAFSFFPSENFRLGSGCLTRRKTFTPKDRRRPEPPSLRGTIPA